MKNTIKNTVFIAILIFCNITFANIPDDAGGNIDPQDTAAQIDSKLLLLAIAGVAICYYQFQKKFIIQ